MPEALSKFLSRCGVASRRNATQIIRDGRVSVNGVVVTEPGTHIEVEDDRVLLDGVAVQAPLENDFVYLMLNKPCGVTTTFQDAHAAQTVQELLPQLRNHQGNVRRLNYAGRLDRDSEGLLLFSDDGAWIHLLTHPRYGVRKEYLVQSSRLLSPRFRKQLTTTGVTSEGEVLKAEEITEISPFRSKYFIYRFVLNEGRKREIRRMVSAAGAETLSLCRIQMGGVALGKLAPGAWRMLTQEELATIQSQVDSPPEKT